MNLTDKVLSSYIQCGLRFKKTLGDHYYSPETELLFKTILQFLQETKGEGHILKLLDIYDRLRAQSYQSIEEWRYRKDREQLINFHKIMPVKKESPAKTDWKNIIGLNRIPVGLDAEAIESHIQQLDFLNGNLYVTEYSANIPIANDNLEMDPLYDIKAMLLKDIYPEMENVYITVYQLHGKTLHIFKTKQYIELFKKEIFLEALKEIVDDRLKDEASINLSCPSCSYKAQCSKYQEYCESLGKQRDIVSLLIRRSILNGQRMECADEMWRINKLITQQVEQQGQIEYQGIKFFLEPKVKRRWDPFIVKDILSKEGLWNDGMMKVDEPAVNKILEKNPELIAKLHRAIVATETSYELKGQAGWEPSKKLTSL